MLFAVWKFIGGNSCIINLSFIRQCGNFCISGFKKVVSVVIDFKYKYIRATLKIVIRRQNL